MRKRLLDGLDELIDLCNDYIQDVDGPEAMDLNNPNPRSQSHQAVQDYLIAKRMLKDLNKLADNVTRKGYKF